jgi:hypothetical protein
MKFIIRFLLLGFLVKSSFTDPKFFPVTNNFQKIFSQWDPCNLIPCTNIIYIHINLSDL